VHDVHDTQHGKPRSSGRPCDFLRVCGRRGVGRGRQLPRCGDGAPSSGSART
jgi:hypothetical protein